LNTLFVSPDFKPDPGGIAELHLNLLTRFPSGSVEVSTVRAPPGWRDDFPFRVRRLPFGFRESSRLQNVARWTLEARRRARAIDARVLQIGTLRPCGPVGAWVQRLDRRPYVLYAHGNDVLKERRKVGRSALYRTTARDVLGRASAVIANSAFTAALVRDLSLAAGAPEAAERVRVVHPGADPARFHPGDAGVAALRARLGLEGARVALTVARLEARKGIDRALEAVAALAATFPDLVYVVVGEGPRRAALEARAGAPDLSGRVHFVGRAADGELPALYRMADVFLLPSRREGAEDVEGFGLALSEASASGLPVIGGRAGGVPEAVLEGETGLLVTPEDPREIAGALRALLADPPLAARLGAGGRAAVQRYFNWDRAAAEAWAIAREAADGRPSVAARRSAAS
jgi:phosphatidylinositol alpha-1,6-mannosyltransferase